MKKSAKEFNNFISDLYDNNSEFAKSYDTINKYLDKSEFGCDLESIFDAYAREVENKIMYLRHVKYNNETYLQIIYNNFEGEYALAYSVKLGVMVNGVEINILPYDLIDKLKELAYMGYTLIQSKEWTTIEVDNLYSVEQED